MNIIPIKEIRIKIYALEMALRVTYLHEGKLIPISKVPFPLIVLLKSVVIGLDMTCIIGDTEVLIHGGGIPVSRDLIEPRIQPSVISDKIDNAPSNSKHLRSLCRNCIIQLRRAGRPNVELMWDYVTYYCELFYGCWVFKYIDHEGQSAYFNLEEFVQQMYSQTDEEAIETCTAVLSNICESK